MRAGDLAGVRTAVEGGVRQPPFDDVLARAHRIRRRHRAVGLLATLGVAALVLALAQPVRKITEPPPPAPTPEPSFEVNTVVFTDRQTGYAVLGPCAVQGSCTTSHSLARTDDGGQSWQRLTLPMLDPGPDQFIGVEARGRQDVSLLVGDQRYLSHDGGTPGGGRRCSVTAHPSTPSRADSH